MKSAFRDARLSMKFVRLQSDRLQSNRLQLMRQMVPKVGLWVVLVMASAAVGCGGPSYVDRLEAARDEAKLLELYEDRGKHSAEAAIALGELQSSSAVDALIAGLQDEDTFIVQNSVRALGDIGDVKAIAPLMERYRTADSDLQDRIAKALGAIATAQANTPQPVIESLSAYTTDADANVRRVSLQTLGEMAHPATLPLLTPAAQDAESSVRQVALWALGKTADPQVIPTLSAALQDGDAAVREAVVKGLSNINDPQVVGLLIGALQDTEVAIQRGAIDGLGQLNAASAVEPLRSLLTSSPDVAVRQSIIDALALIDDPASIEAIAAALNDSDYAVKSNAIDALGAKQSANAISPLLNYVANGGSSLDVEEALVAIGPGGVPSLISGLGSDNPNVRLAVVVALGQLGDERAIAPLVERLTDVPINRAVGEALHELSWEPQSDREQILFWVARRNGTDLQADWAKTQSVLLSEVDSGAPSNVQNALYAFINLGNAEVIPILKDRLAATYDVNVAEAFLNCGHPELEQAAETWAANNGYVVETLPTTTNPDIQWGSW